MSSHVKHVKLIKKSPPVVPLHPWSWPNKPWSRIHIDYAGPFMGKMFMLVMDAYTKWLDVHITTTSSSTVTIELLRKSSNNQLPEVVVSDNAANFTSEQFQAFMKANGVKHVRIPPCYPSSNGVAERAVQTLKEGLKKLKVGSIETKLSRFLFAYRVTPHSSTGISPAKLMFNRRLHSSLDNLRPDLTKRMHQGQEQQKSTYDRRNRARDFKIGDLVYARNYGPGAKWLPEEVVDVIGSTMYEVCLADGHNVRKDANQLRLRVSVENHEEATVESDSSDDDFDVKVPSSNEDVLEEPGTERSVDTKTPGESANSNEPEEPHITSEGDIVKFYLDLDVHLVQGTVQIVMVNFGIE